MVKHSIRNTRQMARCSEKGEGHRNHDEATLREAKGWQSARGFGISLAMIVKNEAHCLERCLRSVRGLVDEIILVDTGSTDDTVRIATKEGAKVFHFLWVNDFAAARNEGLQHCSYDWILVLDADESIDPMDHAKIREDCLATQAWAFRVPLRNYCTSASYSIRDAMAERNISSYQEGREYPYFVETRLLRLCRNHPELAFTGRVHELLEPFLSARNLPIEDLTGVVIHHFGKLDVARESVKVKHYLELALRESEADPRNAQAHFNVVQQGMFSGDWAAVLSSAKAYLRLRSTGPSSIYFGAALALQKLGRDAEALAYFDTLLGKDPHHALALAHRGISLAALGREREAECNFKKAMHINPSFARPFVEFTELAFRQGRMDEARAVIQQGVKNNPTDARMHTGLLLLDLRLNDMDQAMTDARRALELVPEEGGGLWHRLAAAAALKDGRIQEAISILDSAIARFPENNALQKLRSEINPEDQSRNARPEWQTRP